MRRFLIIIQSALLLLLASCIHKGFDTPPIISQVECEIGLQYYDTEMPLHTIVNHNESRAESEDSPMSRHIIKIFDLYGQVATSVIITDEAYNATVTRHHKIHLSPGKYTAVCWTDFTAQPDSDWHYDTSAFPKLELRCSADDKGFLVHKGNTLWRDAYCGRRFFNVEDDGRITYDDGSTAGFILVEMRRPMARFLFEATDFEEFVEANPSSHAKNETSTGLLDGFNITFKYHEYMPSIFNAQTDAPVDSRIGAVFAGEPFTPESGNGSIEIGSDFVFVHPRETAVKVSMEVRDAATDKLVANVGPLKVPLCRNRLTIVRGRFLTSSTVPGIVIDTDFSGDYNIEIK